MSDLPGGPRPPAGPGGGDRVAGAPPRPSRPADGASSASSVATAQAPAGRPQPGAPGRPAGAGGWRGPRRARLTVKRVDPWSVLKFSFVFSVAILVIWIVAVGMLYAVLSGMGLFDKINDVLADFSTKDGVAEWQVTLSASRVLGWAAVVGGVNAVLFTALATLGAFMYNLCSSLAGGLEVTLTERE